MDLHEPEYPRHGQNDEEDHQKIEEEVPRDSMQVRHEVEHQIE
jgi:hypothetical protein